MSNIDLQEIPEYSDVPMEARIFDLLKFVRGEHREEINFLLKNAKLRIKHDPKTWIGWNNVTEHNVFQARAMKTLLQAMNYDTNEAKRLVKYAFVHNPTICRDIFQKKTAAGKEVPRAEQFTTEEELELEARFDAMMGTIDPTCALRVATSPEFFDHIAMQEGETIEEKAMKMPFSDLLVYYVDALFDDGNLIPAHDRIGKMEIRRPDLNADADRTKRLGMQYWEAERKVSTEIQKSVFERLKDNGIELAAAEDVPEFIRKLVGQEMSAAA